MSVAPTVPARNLDAATLTLAGQSYSLPVIEGSEGERAIDISSLRTQTGCITLDPGFGNTGSCESAITFIDGDAGIVIVDPSPIVLDEYRFRQRQSELERARLDRLRHTPAVTLDGQAVELLANIELPGDGCACRLDRNGRDNG